MSIFLGIDTSNYTSSIAAYEETSNTMLMQKQILSVSKGQKGLRQSEAVFQHVLNMPNLMDKLFEQIDKNKINAVSVSQKPRNVEGSYMPCFQSGLSFAKIISKTLNVPLYKTSHQVGHILAAIYSISKPDLLKKDFIAFHISGGTTEAVLVKPCRQEIIKTLIIAKTLDLNAGQAIDRVGLALGLPFPSGSFLEDLALKSDKVFSIKPTLKGCDCCLSGLENLCMNMIISNQKPQDVAKFCIEYIKATLNHILICILEKYGNLPLVFSGGVMSNTIIREFFYGKYGAFFPQPEFSADNAAGVAYYAYLKGKENGL